MPFKITALKNVRVVVPLPQGLNPAKPFQKPNTESLQWLEMAKGESIVVRVVEGVHPDDAPGEMACTKGGIKSVGIPPFKESDLPQEHFGLIRIEIAPKE